MIPMDSFHLYEREMARMLRLRKEGITRNGRLYFNFHIGVGAVPLSWWSAMTVCSGGPASVNGVVICGVHENGKADRTLPALSAGFARGRGFLPISIGGISARCP